MSEDKVLTCSDCNSSFTFTASEQDFYTQKGFTEPRRCAPCRSRRKAARAEDGGGYSFSPGSERAGSFGGSREMFTAVCSGCGGEARVPFRPSGNKPVFCSDCFRSSRG